MKRLLALLLVLCSPLVFAHNGLEHVMGTVAKISASSLEVTTPAGKNVTVMLDAATKWMKGTSAVPAASVKQGERVVIHARPQNGKLEAVEITVGTAAVAH